LLAKAFSMKIRHWMVLSGLLVLVALAFVALVVTEPGRTPSSKKAAREATTQSSLVDQKPLQTARRLAGLASTPEEESIAHEILVNADHDVDLAFAEALRDAREHPVKPTPEIRKLQARVDKDAAVVDFDGKRVNDIKKQLAAAPEAKKDDLQQQLELAQAEAVMDQDELDDAREDLTRAGGDTESRIQRLLQEHEQSQHDTDKSAAPSAPPADLNYSARNLYAQVMAWTALRDKNSQLTQAQQDAKGLSSALTTKHDAFEKHVEEEHAQKQAVSSQAAGIIQGDQDSSAPNSKQKASEAITSLHHFSEDQKALSGLDKRVENEQEIAQSYGNWVSLVQSRQQTALHGIIRSFMWILLVVLLAYLCMRVIDRYFFDLAPEKKRLISVRVVVRFSLQALGALLILFVVFGAPSQTPTILGLAGAGLTVALKDFIVAFVGWFVLMGRNGIRVGDWVEINGVGGEVVEINLLRTVLLETGNWTDSGHPTGRKVAFVNNYAVEGHYFNFSTSGQWSWDELQVLSPAGEDPYPVIDQIQKLVVADTQANSDLAEQEWQRATNRYRVKSFSAIPSLNMRPTPGGIEVKIRYIVHAHERFEVRARLYGSIVDLLQHPHQQAAAAKLPSGPGR
jgi:small-conductance mechanosensitive channel